MSEPSEAKTVESTANPQDGQRLRAICLEMAIRVDLNKTTRNSHVDLARDFEAFIKGEGAKNA